MRCIDHNRISLVTSLLPETHTANLYWFLLSTPKSEWSRHHAEKLSKSAISATRKIAQSTSGMPNDGAHGPSHQNASAKRSILSRRPRFWVITIFRYINSDKYTSTSVCYLY